MVVAKVVVASVVVASVVVANVVVAAVVVASVVVDVVVANVVSTGSSSGSSFFLPCTDLATSCQSSLADSPLARSSLAD